MERYNLKVDNRPSITFLGEVIAEASSTNIDAYGAIYSGHPHRWQHLCLYKTQAGKFVCRRIDCTEIYGVSDKYSCYVCDKLDQVKAFFGHDFLAKILYERAGIDDKEEVE